MGATTRSVSNTPRDAMPLRNSLYDAFNSGNVGAGFANPNPNMGQNPYNQSTMQAGRVMSGSMGGGQVMPGGNRWLNAVAPGLGAQVAPIQNNGASEDFLNMLNNGLFSQGPSLDSFADPNGALFTGVRGGFDQMFNQNRDIALAQAKEASGNLTGTGYANNLGTVMNRSLGDQNALLSQLLSQYAMAQYGQGQQNAQNNNNRFLQLMAQMSGGFNPNQIMTSGGAGAILGPLGALAGTALGGPVGGAIGGSIGSGIGGANAPKTMG